MASTWRQAAACAPHWHAVCFARNVAAKCAKLCHVVLLRRATRFDVPANPSGQLGNDSTTPSRTPVAVTGLTSGVTAISAGGSMTCALADGGVQCWGYNFYGDLGNNTKANSSVPVPVMGLTSGVQEIATAPSGYHACALTRDGIRCWGWNTYGQLGNDAVTDSSVPVALVGSWP